MAISICRHMMRIMQGSLVDYEYPDELIKESIARIPKIS